MKFSYSYAKSFTSTFGENTCLDGLRLNVLLTLVEGGNTSDRFYDIITGCFWFIINFVYNQATPFNMKQLSCM